MVIYIMIPERVQQSTDSLEAYSPPLSDYKTLILFESCLVLHKIFELLEPLEDLTLGLQEIDPSL